MAEPGSEPEDVVVQLVLEEVDGPWPVGGTKIVNDDRPVDDLVDVTTIVDKFVVQVDDDEPELSVPEVEAVPDCAGERLAPVKSVEDDPSVVVHVEETEPAGGHNVISDSEVVWDPDEPAVAGVIVKVCTPGEPEPLGDPDVEVLVTEPELVPDFVTVRMLSNDGVVVVDKPGIV